DFACSHSLRIVAGTLGQLARWRHQGGQDFSSHSVHKPQSRRRRISAPNASAISLRPGAQMEEVCVIPENSDSEHGGLPATPTARSNFTSSSVLTCPSPSPPTLKSFPTIPRRSCGPPPS